MPWYINTTRWLPYDDGPNVHFSYIDETRTFWALQRVDTELSHYQPGTLQKRVLLVVDFARNEEIIAQRNSVTHTQPTAALITDISAAIFVPGDTCFSSMYGRQMSHHVLN